MLFMGTFVLFVLPIALIYMTVQLKNSPTFGHTVIGAFTRLFLYVVILLIVVADLVLIGQLFRSF